MTKEGKNARTGIDRLEAHSRLRKAKAFHLVARESIGILRDAGLDRASVLSNAVLAAVAYTDAVTIASDGRMNQKDHATAPAVLREGEKDIVTPSGLRAAAITRGSYWVPGW